MSVELLFPGFTHIEARCGACDHIVMHSFDRSAGWKHAAPVCASSHLPVQHRMSPSAIVSYEGTHDNMMSLSRYSGQIRPTMSVFWTFAGAELLIAGHYRGGREPEHGFAFF